MSRRSLILALELSLILLLAACKMNSTDPNSSSPDELSATGTPKGVSGEVVGTTIDLPPRVRDDRAATLLSVELVGRSNEVVGAQYPAYLEAEIAGRDILRIAGVAGRHETDGRIRLVTYEELRPEQATTEGSAEWRDGVHELSHFWSAEGNYLTDGVNGDYVVLRETRAANEDLFSVRGRVRLDEGDNYVAAELIIVDGEAQPKRIIDSLTGETLEPGQGDEFQAMNILVQRDGSLAPEPGVRIQLGNPSQLLLEKRPLPAGEYSLGFIAETESGVRDSAFANFDVVNDDYRPDFSAFYDPENGFQFLFPADWKPPTYDNGRLISSSPDESIELSIITQPDMALITVEQLRRMTLNAYGPVQILYEESVVVANETALRTVYGYEAESGLRTGVLLTMSKEGTGYIVDLDGPAVDEKSTLQIVHSLGESWRFRSKRSSTQMGRWARISWDDNSVAIPSHYHQLVTENGWRKFSSPDGDTFFALLLRPNQGTDAAAELEYWLEVAEDGTDAFSRGEIYDLSYAGRAWLRADFAYVNKSGAEIWGSVMSASDSEGLILTWTESPATTYREDSEDTFQLILADLRLSRQS